jgi:flagellar hook protein FlgE
MKEGRLVLSLLLLAGGCVDITINNGSGAADAGGGSVVWGLGGTSGGTRGAGGANSDGSASQPPRPTDSVTIRGNLNETAVAPGWDPRTPQTTSNFTTSLVVYDSLGTAIQIDIYFGKDDAVRIQPGDSGSWTYHVMTDGGNLAFESDGATAAFPGMATQIAVGTLRFDTAGRLVSNTVTAEGFYPKDAVYPQMLTFNFGTGTDSGGNGLDGLTQYAATSAVSFVAVSGSAFAP